jgi:hypothetical protein
MANEFEFLRSRWPKLAALGADAARLVDFSPVTALSSLRDYCEWAADITLDLLGNPMAPDTPQLERLSALKALGSVPPDILQKFHNIRSTEDRVSANPLGDPNEARARMADAVDIGRWMMRQGDGARTGYTSRQAPVRGYGEDVYATGRRTPVSQNTSSYNTGYHTGSYAPQNPPDNYEGGPDYPEDGYGDHYEDDPDGGYGAPRRGGRGGNGGRGGGGGFDLGRYKQYLTMPVIISAVLVIVLLVALILILTRCGGKTNSGTTSTTPVTTPSETMSMLITPTPTPETSPSPQGTNEVAKYVDEFDSSSVTKSHDAWTTYYLGSWKANSHTGSFSIYNGGSGTDAKGVLYEHGLGWFVKSSEFGNSSSAMRALTFKTDGQYDKLVFDMGVDKEWLFDDAKDCGTYQILVFLNDDRDPVYTSDEVNYNYYKTDISVDIQKAQKVKIRLVQKKGSKGSLNVVLGNARFVSTSGDAATTTAAGETTTAAAGTTTTAVETTTAVAED